ncbi:hypothetical protein BN1723_008316 [Verticillium longisporum]|uniref:Uncharacterized protein n=1 Tax=Verticillium longisporum TaxID=100787 RepID=A0A0G4NRM4_VERLO|nr:hypothetical protein BN1708_002942 [Verticillium longisporum]CRK48996.1 hypothetical protein BN1723_008316 [Verticillium longisporum]
MSRKGKERDRHDAFREWAVDPTLYDQYGDKAESSIPVGWPSSLRDLPYASGQLYQQYIHPPDLAFPDDSLAPEELALIQQSSGMKEPYPVDDASRLYFDVEFGDYMNLEVDDLSISNQRDESVSSSSPFDANTHDEPMTIAGPSSPYSASGKQKHKSSSYSTSCRSRKPPLISHRTRNASSVSGKAAENGSEFLRIYSECKHHCVSAPAC